MRRRRLVGQRPRRRIPGDGEGLDRAIDVLQVQVAEILEAGVHAAGHRLVHGARDQDAAGQGFRLEPRRDVDAVAEQVVLLDDQVAEMQAHAQEDGAVIGLVARGVLHGLLQFDGGGQRFDGGAELGQYAVARQLDDAAATPSHDRHDGLLADGAQASDRAAFVAAHEPGIAHHVGSEDRCQSALLARQWVVLS